MQQWCPDVRSLCVNLHFWKKTNRTNIQQVYFQTGSADRARVVEVKLTKPSLFSPLPHGSTRQHCVPTQTTPRWRFWQINPVLFFLSLSYFPSKSEIHTSFQTWDMHFCSNIYPVSTIKVKICVNKKKNETWTKNKKNEDLNASVSANASEPFIKWKREKELERGWKS